MADFLAFGEGNVSYIPKTKDEKDDIQLQRLTADLRRNHGLEINHFNFRDTMSLIPSLMTGEQKKCLNSEYLYETMGVLKTTEALVTHIAKGNISPHKDQNTLQKSHYPKTPKSLPKTLPKALKDGIHEYAKLFQSSIALTADTKNHALSPKVGDHANQVYLTKAVKNKAAIVFKPNQFAARAITCAGIARLLGLGKSVPPAKIGTANVKDNTVYKRLSIDQKLPILVDPEMLENVTDVEFNPQNIPASCRYNSLDIKLVPQGNGYIALIEKPTGFEAAVKNLKNFVILTDDEQKSYLAPKNDIYEVRTKGKHSYVTIDNFTYQIDKEDSVITLSVPNLKQNKAAIQNDLLLEEGLMMQLNFANFINSSPIVLVKAEDAVSVEIEPDDKQTSFKFDEKNYKAIKLIDDTYCVKESSLEGFESEVSESDEERLSFDDDKGFFNQNEAENSDDEFPFNENEVLIFCRDKKGCFYLASEEDVHLIETQGNSEFITLNSSKYFLKAVSKETFQIKGECVKGTIQAQIQDIFTHPPGEKDLYITTPSIHRDNFFARIDMISFIESFILTILIRPQDGKIINLEQSNVLFQAIENGQKNHDPFDQNIKLRAILIDLDETFPPQNGYSTDPQFTERNLKKVHSVRCGLMGFPQARIELKEKDKQAAVTLLELIVQMKSQIRLYLINSEHNEKTTNATLEIIDSLQKFLQDFKLLPWSLETLFFEVFPEYKAQWNMLNDEDPAIKASRIGLESEETLIPRDLLPKVLLQRRKST